MDISLAAESFFAAARLASQAPFAILAGFGNAQHHGQRSSIGRAADL
jgi:hypothetical protein